MPPLIYFVRHGQTDWNAEFRLQGQADTDLNDLGRRQADQNGRVLAGLIAWPEAFDFVASPMRRTRETMERLRAAMGLDPHGYRTDARLVEVNFGDWQGFTYEELELRDVRALVARYLHLRCDLHGSFLRCFSRYRRYLLASSTASSRWLL